MLTSSKSLATESDYVDHTYQHQGTLPSERQHRRAPAHLTRHLYCIRALALLVLSCLFSEALGRRAPNTPCNHNVTDHYSPCRCLCTRVGEPNLPTSQREGFFTTLPCFIGSCVKWTNTTSCATGYCYVLLNA